MARDFAAVLSDKGAPGRAIVGSTSPNGLAKVMRTDMADFAIVTVRHARSSAPNMQPDWPKRSPLVARLAPETMEVVAPKRGEIDRRSSGQDRELRRPGQRHRDIAPGFCFRGSGITVNPTYEPLTDALDALSAGKRGAVVVLGGQGRARARATSAATADITSSPFPGRRAWSRSTRRRGWQPPTVRASSPPTTLSRRSPNRWR